MVRKCEIFLYGRFILSIGYMVSYIYIIAALMAISGYLQYTSDFPPAKTIGTVLLIVSVLLVVFAGKASGS